jgi:hypothetical protein
MPAQYEKIRDSYLKAGKSKAEAERLAAMTYNAHRKSGEKPVTGHHDYAEGIEPEEAEPIAEQSPDVAKFYSADDLQDQNQFTTIRHVPILDENQDPEHGEVDEPLHRLIPNNTHDRFAEGKFPTISLGHTRSKQTVVVVKDGKQHVFPATEEDAQPPIVGYASHFDVAPYAGRPCLHAAFHVHKDYAEKVRGFPFRSVERLAPNPEKQMSAGERQAAHAVDRIALLKTPPRRDLGVLRYERDPSQLVRHCYSRSDWPSLGACSQSHDYAAPEATTMPTMAPASPETETPPDAAPPDDAGGDQMDDGDAPISSMTKNELMSMLVMTIEHVLGTAAEPGAEPPAEGEPAPGGEAEPAAERAQYESGEMDDAAAMTTGGGGEMSDTEESQYEAPGNFDQAGGSDTYIPGTGGIGKEKRKMYERGSGGAAVAVRGQPVQATEQPKPAVTPPAQTKPAIPARSNGNGNGHAFNLGDLVTRHQYAKDQGEFNEILDFLITKVTDQETTIIRKNYEANLNNLVEREGYVIPPERIRALVDAVDFQTEPTMIESKLDEIRSCYGRRAVGTPMVPVGGTPFGRTAPQGAPDLDESKRATILMIERRNAGTPISFGDALKLARGV